MFAPFLETRSVQQFLQLALPRSVTPSDAILVEYSSDERVGRHSSACLGFIHVQPVTFSQESSEEPNLR